ncbi:hypothetical protein PVAND_001233 [Polypedilum vanderplanki]|uniref:TMC domain-containing protein n=1 Tax=Polypedilum vanderplanki TaxID=319348 RepID=A0A9J6BMA8_POLVA|nr:hypothetical protein PVAND_001233 [Polypedilum vanderplanki]
MKERESLDVRKRSIFSSSAESLESFDDSVPITTQEQLYDNIRLHKEIIQSVKLQPWSLAKKYKIVQKAKQYVARHEDTLQERFAQSGNTKDLYARFKILIADKFKYLKREFLNFCALLIPWEIRIKEIESRFGSVVASYFIFLRWLFWVNIMIASFFVIFVIVPEVLIVDQRKNLNGNETTRFFERKRLLEVEKANASNFLTIWDFEGQLKYSPIFYGMAENSRTSKLGSKEEECVFSWKLFTGWDYMIGHSETASNRIASVVLGFKEALLEEAEKQKDKKNWKVITLRIFANLNIIFLLGLSVWAVIKVVERSGNIAGNSSWWRRNEITIVMTLISFIFPMLFEILGIIEYYHPRMQLRLQLARIMSLNLLNLGSLIWALFKKVNIMTTRMDKIKEEQKKAKEKLMAKLKGYTEPTTKFTPTSVHTTTTQSTTFETITIPSTTTTTTESIETTFSTLKSYTDEIISKITEYLTTSEIPFDEQTAVYDYSNTDYFEPEPSPSAESFSFNDSISEALTGFMENMTNFTTDDYTKTFFDIVTNVTNFNLSTTTEFPLDQYYYEDSTEYYISDYQPNVQSQNLMMIGTQTANVPFRDDPTVDDHMKYLSDSLITELRTLCWETMFGQELVKLTVMDLLLTVLQILMFDFFRALFVRYLNSCWCWDLEKKFPKYGDFKIAENILHLVNNQGMVWMGMFFSPGLAIINLIKLIIIMYLRSWAVLTCNVPHEVIFRASRSNNFYLTLLLTMLFLCVLPVSYAIFLIKPSSHCGPFSEREYMYLLFTDTVKSILPKGTHGYLRYFVSPAAIIPLLLLLVLFIYYLISLTGSLKRANQDLKTQLHKERTEERKKMMKLMEDKIMEVKEANRLSARWKRVLDVRKSSGGIVQPPPPITAALNESDADRKKLLLARAMKNILRKKYSNEEESIPKITTTEPSDAEP